MQFVKLLIILILIYIFFSSFYGNNAELTLVKSTIDNNEYFVRDLQDKNIAANKLAFIRQNKIKLVNHMLSQFPDDPRVTRLKYRYKPNKISEGPEDPKLTSYTLNKGEKVVYCLRSKKHKNELHEKNTLMFVAIHELSHIMSVTKGHNDEFKKNFKFLLENAVKIGIYQPIDYSKSPQEYCGININETPLS